MKNKTLSMFYWIKNKKAIEEEHQKEDEQHNQLLVENYELKRQISKLENQLTNEIKLKNRYPTNSQNLRKKLNEYRIGE